MWGSLRSPIIIYKLIYIIGERSEPPLSVELSEISLYLYIYKTEKTFKNEQRSKDAAAKKRPNTSGVYREN